MTDIEFVIADLETAKTVLCTPGMANGQMLIRIGQAITRGIQTLLEQNKLLQESQKIINDNIEKRDTVDAVPVIRCKDCKHHYTIKCILSDDDWFCANGEAREGDDK